jgi:site-specific DNA-methyltransferase (cytosine-N4-specific)
MAASDTFVYSRWQIQCKNTTTVDIDVVAKEVGMSFLTKADVFLIITTGSFTRDAIQYADTLCTQSRYYVILIDGDHLKSIREDKTNIVPILNRIAKRTFVRREYGMTSSEANTIIDNLNEDNQASFLYNQFNASPDDS